MSMAREVHAEGAIRRWYHEIKYQYPLALPGADSKPVT